MSKTLNTTAVQLYEDLCRTANQVDDLKNITLNQIEFLLSLVYNGISPIDHDGSRKWEVKGKKKHGWWLDTQKISQKFFSEK